MTESNYAKQALPEWQKLHPGARIFRNNTGMAWQGKQSHYTEIQGHRDIAHRIIENPRPIFFGVGFPKKDKKTGRTKQTGGGDYIGWESMTLCELLPADVNIPGCNGNCQTCSFNKRIAIFLNLETKSKDGKESPDQIKFRKAVQEAGGISIILQEGENENKI